MTEKEAINILIKVKAIWASQTTDKLTVDEWFAALKPIEYADAFHAVEALRDEGRESPPNVGIVKRLAVSMAERRKERVRRQHRQIEQKPSPEQVAENKRRLRELIESLSQKISA